MNAVDPLPHQSLPDAIAEQLRLAIWDDLVGDRLVERSLARQFNVSHIPLREALARLVEEGLVVRLPSGARVAALSKRSLDDRASSCSSSSWCSATGRFTAEAHAELQATVREMVTAARRRDLVGVHKLDQRFHEQLWELADHAAAARAGGADAQRTAHFFRAAATSLEPADLRAHAESHQQLLDAIVGRPESGGAGNARACRGGRPPHRRVRPDRGSIRSAGCQAGSSSSRSSGFT